MFKNYLKIAWRNLVKNKAFSTINILGLAIGLCSFMIIMLWISHELSFDNFHSNKNQLYRVMINGKDSNTGEKYTSIATPLALANALRDDVPGIKAVCESNWEGIQYLKAGDNSLSKYGTEVSSEFFSLFKFRFVQGDSKTALANPESIVLTEQTAKALFGKDDPMNKIVRWNNIVDLMVTGIVQDIPTNSYFKNFQYFMPFSNYEKRQSWVAQARNDWGNFSFNMFVELEPNVTYAQIEPKIKNLIINHKEKDTHQVMLFPLAKWRLYNEFRNWDSTAGRIDYVKMFGLVGILILLIACINFMNLSTARSEKRAREVGVRKSIGSSRLQLIAQFLGESILLSSLSFLVSILLITLILPLFNNLLETNISLPFSNPLFWLFSLIAILFTGVLAGSYPAFYLSSFQAIKVLKGQITNNKGATLPRKFLVVTQFVASLALIMSTLIIYQQLQFAQARPSGYNPNGLLLVDMKSDLQKNYNVVKNELENSGVIESVVKASAPIHSIWSNWLVTDFTGKIGDEKASVAYIATVPNYFSTLGIKFKQGRDFYSESDSSSIIINEATVERLRLQDPIGKTIKLEGGNLNIVGVVENTIMANPFELVGPAVFTCNPGWANSMMFRIKPNTKPGDLLAKIAPIFRKHNPAFPFEYEFADTEYGKKFDFELMIGKLAAIFSILAIFISCLGLFGLAAFIAEKRTKEIGIRKILGASIAKLWMMLSKEFILLVLLGSSIAVPISSYYLNQWLHKYEYRINIDYMVFVWAIVLALLITLITVSFQSIKAAIANPVKSLRTE